MFESENGESRASAVGLLLLINALALSFFFSPGSSDVEIWNNWMREISTSGLVDGYTHSDTDYPPLAFVILAGVVKCAGAFGVSPFLVLKCSLFLFLVVTTACFYWITRNLMFTIALELALTLNSMALAYLDIYVAPFLIAALFLLQRRNLNPGFVLFAISCFIKWQPLIIAPFVCLYVLGNARERAVDKISQLKNQTVPFALVLALVGLPLLLIFGWKIFDSLHRAMTYHIFLSAYGLNLGWIHTWILHLTEPEKYGGLQGGVIDVIQTRDPSVIWPEKSLFYLSYAVSLISFLHQEKTFERLIVYSILGYMSYFVFNTSVHENHLFLVCCLGWVLAVIERGQLVRCISLSVAANANLFLFYGVFGQRINPVIAGVDITLFFAVANLCLFAGFLLHVVKTDRIDFGICRSDRRHDRRC